VAETRYAAHINMQGNELRDVRVQEVATLPTPTPERAGMLVRYAADGRVYLCTGTAWALRATDSDALQGQAPAHYLNRANHTGTQPASSITGLADAVALTPLSGLAPPTGPISLNGQPLLNAPAATTVTGVPNWGQVTDLVSGLGFRQARAASTANVATGSTGVGTVVDGVTLAVGDIVLLTGQTDPADNGLYRVGAANLVRDASADTATEMPSGTVVVVDHGTVNGDRMWMLTTPAPFTVGTTPLTWTPYGTAPQPYTAGNGITISGNQVSATAGSGIIVDGTGIRLDPDALPDVGHVEAEVPVPSSGTGVNIVHNLGRAPLPVVVMEVATRVQVQTGVTFPDDDSVTLSFNIAPVLGQYRVSIG
jgi:hypothetical protein